MNTRPLHWLFPPEMLKSVEVPPLLRRPHIQRGYRPLHQPRHYYFKSAFLPHNEMLNVWTHFVPLFVLIYYYAYPELSSGSPRFPVLLLHFGTAVLLLGSSFAHLLHSRSPHDHIFWFLVDFAGIAVFALCIGLQRYSCERELNPWLEWLYLPSLFCVSILGQFLSSSSLFVLHPFWPGRTFARMGSCLFVAIWLYLPLIHRYTDPSPEDDLRAHSRAFQWLMVSGVFMGGNFPERFFPGIFDVVGYGHQLFHICVIMLGWNLLDAASEDCPVAPMSSPVDLRHCLCLLTVAASSWLIVHAIVTLMGKARERKYD